jgi:hypothetical protein
MMAFKWLRIASRSIDGAALLTEMAKKAVTQSRAAATIRGQRFWSGVMIRMIGFSLTGTGAQAARARPTLRLCANSSEEYGLLSLMELYPGHEPGIFDLG